MDKLKNNEATGKREKSAQVEFVAPYPLPDCVLRIRDTRVQDTGFMSPGIDPSFEKIEPGVYRFKIRRTWYDYRSRRHQSMVYLDGYLKGIDQTSTVVIAETHTALVPLLVTLLLIGLMLLSGLVAPKIGAGLVFIVGAVVFLIFYLLWLAWDRRTLVRVVHRALSDEALW